MAKYKSLYYDFKSIVPICSQSMEIIKGWGVPGTLGQSYRSGLGAFLAICHMTTMPLSVSIGFDETVTWGVQCNRLEPFHFHKKIYISYNNIVDFTFCVTSRKILASTQLFTVRFRRI